MILFRISFGVCRSGEAFCGTEALALLLVSILDALCDVDGEGLAMQGKIQMEEVLAAVKFGLCPQINACWSVHSLLFVLKSIVCVRTGTTMAGSRPPFHVPGQLHQQASSLHKGNRSVSALTQSNVSQIQVTEAFSVPPWKTTASEAPVLSSSTASAYQTLAIWPTRPPRPLRTCQQKSLSVSLGSLSEDRPQP